VMDKESRIGKMNHCATTILDIVVETGTKICAHPSKNHPHLYSFSLFLFSWKEIDGRKNQQTHVSFFIFFFILIIVLVSLLIRKETKVGAPN